MRRIAILIVLLFVNLAHADDKLIDHPTIKALHAKNITVRNLNKKFGQPLNEFLTNAAQEQAWYMAATHDRGEEDFNHRGNNGSPGTRAAKHKYYGIVKENIARGYMSVDETFDAWQKSDSHRDAILAETTDVGFGYAIAKDGTTYWVALYGIPKCSTDHN